MMVVSSTVLRWRIDIRQEDGCLIAIRIDLI